MNSIVKKIDWQGEELSLETGLLARQADGAVVLSVGETMILATVVAKKEIDPKVDFLPLSVDYKEYYASTGKIPGGFFKRDGRLNEHEILTSRIVDRSLRPLFPDDYHADVQVILSLISNDRLEQPDALACVAASAALCVSDIPFPEPVSTVRVAYIEDSFVINPKKNQMEGATLDLIVAGTMDSIVMVEGEMKEVSEEVMLESLRCAHQAIKRLNALQLELKAAAGKPTREYPKAQDYPELREKLAGAAYERLKSIGRAALPKKDRLQKINELFDEVLPTLLEGVAQEELETVVRRLESYYFDLQSRVCRELILNENRRLDGRQTHEIRPIWCRTGYLPRAHGSAIFTRGETQSLTTVTLGSKLDEQTIDYATEEGTKKFMLQYIFPPYSTGEVKPLRSPGRREIGHGNLAERALKNVIPEDNEYTIRVVSEILESNGSSSMATVCAGALALMDAGIQITAPVSGIAMGLIVEGERFAVLSDILGDEDHLGDMDFKVAGTAAGLTACQMDIKVRGLSFEIMAQALAQAKAGREHILNEMLKTLPAPKSDISPYAPRLLRFTIPVDTIGAVIGTGGKVIQEIQRTTETDISIEEENGVGVVVIASPNAAALEAARERILAIVTPPEVGKIYSAVVKNVREAGAFLEFMPGKEGWLHVSEVSNERIPTMLDVVKPGDRLEVMYLGLDPKNNKQRLSLKAVTGGRTVERTEKVQERIERQDERSERTIERTERITDYGRDKHSERRVGPKNDRRNDRRR
ncbi:MAG: polyribonucleotide nucleotidyltransferase [Bacteroidia bacterium]|nr:polyribonucleotide nucleotidyltransferase [Bacteroidia bacterium]MDW8334233.1 polyribonucleotide nucleotidyltransferase [Bacteroidia bacterium]